MPTTTPFDATDRLCINTIRTLSIDMVQKANSGHPGLPLGAAPMAYVLWRRHLRHNPKDPKWANRDRFVLSAGHGCALLYSLLHLTGYDLSLDDLKAFRQWGSRTPGHPEYGVTPGVEATTGPLGQGTANAVGMAIAERALAARYNRPGHTVVDHRVYALVGDGDLMEGVSGEAGSLAGHLKLGKLTYLYDSNHVSLDGPTSMSFTEDTAKRYQAYGWRVLRVEKGNEDLEAIDAALTSAESDTSAPTLIVLTTTIGFGSPHKAGSSEAHGSPLGPDEVKLTKKALGWDPEKFFYEPDNALKRFREAIDAGAKAQGEWQSRLDAWSRANPGLATEWKIAQTGKLPDGWDRDLPVFKPEDAQATRVAGGKALNAIATKVPWLIGGDADLSESTKTGISGGGAFDGQTGNGRNLHFGVREHAMGAIVNGITYHGGLRSFAATFFCFSDYMRPPVRIAALSELPSIFVWTHDSVGLGEDGPTHEPVEHLMSLRAMPHLWVIRPADANEAVEAWKVAIKRTLGPTAIVLSRQKLPVFDRSRCGPASELAKGAYVLSDPKGGEAQAILISTGSEVAVAMAAQERLAKDGIRARVVSMPCWEAFEAQSPDYRNSVLPPKVKARVSVEAGSTLGWYRWIGEKGIPLGIDRYGASAPGEKTLEMLGFTAENVAKLVKAALQS